MSPLAERLIDEGLRMDDHPLIVFRSGPAGRRPALAGGPDIAEVVGAIEANPMFHLEAVSQDHLGEVRVYAFLPGFGRK
jgi:hypothetical protein